MRKQAVRLLGKYGVSVTTMGLGMVPLAGFKAKVSYSECENVIKSAFAGGIRYFDCAPMYGFGSAHGHLNPSAVK